MREAGKKEFFWIVPLQDLHGPDPAKGLDAAEAEQRLAQYGPNTATDTPRQSLFLQFLLRFRNPLVILLLAAAVLSALTGDRASFFVIIAVLILSVALDFIQEVRAERTVDALRQSVALKTTVRRDGIVSSLPVQSVVPGDIILLSPGMMVPADGRLVVSKDLYVNQALLTGEAFPVEKNAEDLTTPTDKPGEASNAVFMGASIISGAATMLVMATGKQSQLGRLASILAQRHASTTFEDGIRAFGMTIMRLTVAIVLLVLLINIGLHRPPLQSFMFALALAVGLTPELLPMMVTITLSRGAIRMARARVIVKHLPAMHNLGAMDILCTDKTGTLTEENIRLVSAIDAAGQASDRVFLLAYLNSRLESGIQSPLDQAILDHAQPDIAGWEKIDEVPFDFERRRVSVLLSYQGRRFLIVKGAPEDILKLSTHCEIESDPAVPMDEARRQDCCKAFESLGEQGLRVLAVAVREVDETHKTAAVTDETAMTFAGFATFIDPPKASAAAAIADLAKAGVAVKIITGDNERVTQYVCKMLNFDAGEIMTGDILSGLNEEALAARVEHAHVFCRVTPQQKSRIICALKARGHTVGFMGDGINDAVALHRADAGISVDSATDVAKAAADIVLLEKDLSVIGAGIMEGRQAVKNTEKYILMGSSSNFGNMFSMAAASLFLPFLPMLPIQILLNNLLYDLSQTALPFDYVDRETLTSPIRWDIARIRRFMWTLGPASSLFDFLTFYILLKLFHANEVLFHTGWFVESLVTQVLIVFSIRTGRFMLKSRPHVFLAVTAPAIAALAILLPFTPLGSWFGLSPLPPGFFLFLTDIFLAYILFVETLKKFLWRSFR